jgi:hypothetical protein
MLRGQSRPFPEQRPFGAMRASRSRRMKWMRRVVAGLEGVAGRDGEGTIAIYVLGGTAAVCTANRTQHRHLDTGGERVMVA